MKLYQNGLFRWWPFYASLAAAALGGWILGANGGAADLRWTEALYTWVQNHPNESLLAFLNWLSLAQGGQLPTVLLIVGSVFFWLFCLCMKGKRKTALRPGLGQWCRNAQLIVLASLIVALCSPLLKGKFARERPRYHYENVDFTPWYDFYSRNRENPFKRGSFPSGHTLQATLVLATFHWLGNGLPVIWKGVSLKLLFGGLGALYVAVMGISRIALAKHWIGDVFFAAIIGFWIVSFSAWIVYRTHRDSSGWSSYSGRVQGSGFRVQAGIHAWERLRRRVKSISPTHEPPFRTVDFPEP